MMTEFAIQPATVDDEAFLWQALYFAAHMDEQAGISPESAKNDPALAPYVAGWGDRHSDLGLIARLASKGQAIGAAWIRLMPIGWPLYRYVSSDIPELAIAVLPDYLGCGIGTRLLTTMAEAAAGRFQAIALSVRDNNPARRLYERFGFAAVATIRNRVDGTSLVMKLELR
jgi:ribosomal protein S18 acetylase RimI-like enzyme